MLVASAFGEPRPREAWRRLRYVVSRARAFTSTRRRTLRAFLDWIEGLQRAEVRDPEIGSVESDEDAIHIQTIHSAKGLEYPIVFLGGLGSHRGGRVGSIEVNANRQTLQLACRAGSGWQTSNYEDAVRREKQMADAEAVRLLYVAATRARDHLVLSLFRGMMSAKSTAVIERRLSEADVDLCASVTAREYPEYESAYVAAAAPSVDDRPGLNAATEREWSTRRNAMLESSAQPLADRSWWSTKPAQPPHDIQPPDGHAHRRNVPLIARVDGVLMEERVDLVYASEVGYNLMVASDDESIHSELHAGRIALVFFASTGIRPVAVDITAPGAGTARFSNVDALMERARAELRRSRSPEASGKQT